MTAFYPHRSDGHRARAVLAEIQLGRLKGDLAARILDQARIDDDNDQATINKGATPCLNN